ncbi:hypothetical protein LUZ60_014423 [Juncus effusus]|nr:hypothetical protein LUZ60_014423 [Juncus effusus]
MQEMDQKEKMAETSRSRKRKQREDVPQTERHRRLKINESFSMLQSMVPGLFPKATRTRVIDETISYINCLEHVLMTLDSKRRATLAGLPLLLTQQNSSLTVEVSSSGNMAVFGISFLSSSRQVTMVRVLEVFETNQAEVLTASVASDFGLTRINVTSVVLDRESLERIKMDLMSL